jgi:DNA-binding transcriptional MerR regulator
MEATLTVGAIARRAGVSAKTVRYYEALGIIPSAVRGENDYRYYPRDTVDRIGFIRRAKSLGLTLDEIGSLMALSEDGLCDVISPELHRVLERKVAEIDRQRAELARFRAKLTAAAQQLSPCTEDVASEDCTPCSAFASDCGCLPPAADIVLQQTT